MKQSLYFLSLLFCCLLSFESYSQSIKKYTYLIVRVNLAFDNDVDKQYYRIDPELENPNANSIYNLVKYNTKLKSKGVAAMYNSKVDTSTVLFNYFTTISEALQFLDYKGWQLFSIYNDVQGNSNNISSQAIYYLRRELN